MPTMSTLSKSTATYGKYLLALFFITYFIVFQASARKISIPGSPRAWTSRIQLRQAVQVQHVTLQVYYDYISLGELDGNTYTEVDFGADNQPLRLGISTDTVTFVPQHPDSTNSFCANKINTYGCKIAGITGYYSPATNISTSETFVYSYGDNSNSTAHGYWAEDTVTTGGVSVDLSFGVAQTWNIVPQLGLGIWPALGTKKPSYLDALEQQGKIGGQYVSYFNITGNGTVVLGGTDLNKFTGKFKVWTQYDRSGIIETPKINIIASTNTSDAGPSDLLTGLVTPTTPFIFIPQDLLDKLLTMFPAKLNNQYGGYTLACDYKIDPTWFLEFDLSGVIIKVPFEDLLSSVAVQGDVSCFMKFLPISMFTQHGANFSYVLGGPFMRAAYTIFNPDKNMTALAVANKEISSENIVELGGSFGTPVADLVGTASTGSPSSSNTNPPTSTGGKSSNTGAIVGGVVGGVLGLLAIATGSFFFLRHCRQKLAEPAPPPATSLPPMSDNSHRAIELTGAGVTSVLAELHSPSTAYKKDGKGLDYYGQPTAISEPTSPNDQPITFSELSGPHSQPPPSNYAGPVVELPG
ncbi:hypothetical protein TWF694_011305 [Orbilia ellipsospora]|uniref:Peptidase A1 domain-containing protein n=1 Tax=Orbilia ellipsospora TaxID=2528407 RepID=A0AAV9X647_9PEZI